jgi:hypothetical protein
MAHLLVQAVGDLDADPLMLPQVLGKVNGALLYHST